ncbi:MULTISPECIES: hypothetical protein [unclassified Streptomyces]|uniref:hypothetical protein n=1 Tax=unclassified Streptomyces TaxID=2593676 RepID=UPI002E20D457|nr:hypothetical protein OG217_21365 [Streptomyces sp. NBC_01023]
MTVEEARRTVSSELRAAIRAATPRAVHPADDFESSSVRIAGWDPEEPQSNDALLHRSTVYLAEHGWQILPETTDSEDRSASVSRAGLVEGRLYASNRGLTFTGTLTEEAGR